MRLSFHLFLVGTALTAVIAGPTVAEDDAPAPALTVTATGSALAADPAWRELFVQLGAARSRYSTFEESRYFPFRRTPVILPGEIRILPGRGLSLRYPEPKERIMIVDADGVLLRDAKGRERAAPRDGHAQAATTALTNVLQFDLPALQEAFTVEGTRDGAAWTLTFTPREAELAERLGTIQVDGEDNQLQRIEMRQSDRQRIEIVIGESQADVIFTSAEIQRFFR
ncbi:outer membrane lipoprotein carrier protein LolA [Synoicihabitans lomoniglobus]|uniref:Outer membrane lipoprotein carrier protein LolA n=1 Tax=Synoicihabitans lomoniglobus TaxID=2909285 RepID=A0AAF0CNI5_9BACT|nr:outer membrane lipoprotein carrier protein LolA [Opitutaceae bacterium LMO-M01]WED64460.1 outer membrane lipoprotein carrier protein LolA [Opitutaceae bacterium LMO-M01]